MVDTNFYVNKGPFSLEKVAMICGATLVSGDARLEIKDIVPMEKASGTEICFFYDKKAKEEAAFIKASACVTTEELAPFLPKDIAVLIVKNPKSAALKLNLALYAEKRPQVGIANSAKIAPSAIIGEDCFVGEGAVIGEHVSIGANCQIGHNAVIGDGCKIGNNCRIDANATVFYCIMGNDCFIYSGVRIGHDGFGFIFEDGRHKKIPQLGRVIIGNDVEVGANTCIDRGALDDTVIGDGCRIDNLVQVAHNDKLGRGCILVAMTGIAGSCTFGDYVICGGQTGFADHINVGSGAQIGAQSGIMRDVEPGTVVMGTPAVPIKDFMRQVSFIQKSVKK